MTLNEARELIGHKVVYSDQYIKKNEYGTITYVNDVYVFVKFGNELQSKAVYPKNLSLDK